MFDLYFQEKTKEPTVFYCSKYSCQDKQIYIVLINCPVKNNKNEKVVKSARFFEKILMSKGTIIFSLLRSEDLTLGQYILNADRSYSCNIYIGLLSVTTC